MRCRRDVRNLLEQFDVLTGLVEVVVTDHGTERCATEDAVLFLVHFLEQRALVEFGGPLQIAQQILLRHVEDLDLEHGPRFALLHQELQSAPRRLEPLELGVVQNLIQLQREQVIDLRNAGVDHRFGIAPDGHRAFEHFLDESLDEILAALARFGVATDLALIDDLIEQRQFGGLSRGCLSGRRLGFSHCHPP